MQPSAVAHDESVGVRRHADGLALLHVEKRFGGVKALVDGSLHASRGEVHGILGENGAGKSTLIRILAGVVRSNGGEMLLDGQLLAIRNTRDAIAAGVGTVFQESSLIPALTAAENLLFGRLPLRWDWRVRMRTGRRIYDETFEHLGARYVSPRAFVKDLSLEDRALLEVVKAVSWQPSVLILDEATAALAPDDSAWVLGQARSAASRGSVVLFVSHRIQEVRAVVHRVTVLRSGRTVLETSIGEADDDALIAAMLGHRLEEQYPARAAAPSNEVALEIDDLRVGRTLGPVSFNQRRGEVLGVFALPGQGQRELLMAIAGAVHRSTGRMTLNGRSYAPRSPADAQRRGVVLVPEDRGRDALFLEHSSLMNVTIANLHESRQLGGFLDLRAERRRAASLAERVGLAPERLPHLVSTLSGGNQQKVVFARALVGELKLLVLHDSTRGVDVGTKTDIYRLVLSLADQGIGVVFYSTDVTETIRLTDRILVLEGGRIAGEVKSRSATAEQLLGLAVGRHISAHAKALDAGSGVMNQLDT